VIDSATIRKFYPLASQRKREQGTVVLRVLVKANGSAGTVEVKTSSGYSRLDAAALEAVKSLRFEAATVGGKPVEEWVFVPFVFRLND